MATMERYYAGESSSVTFPPARSAGFARACDTMHILTRIGGAAEKLGVSPRTVEFHRAHIMDKTGARGLPDLVRLWLAAGFPI